MAFGATLRLLRIDAGLSLRSLAQQIGVSGAYLSRVENGHDAPPTPDRLAAIARVLDLPPALLLGLADKVDPYVIAYLEQVPAAASLFLDISRRGLNGPQLARVRAFVESEFPLDPARARYAPLSRLLTPERVVLRLSCTDLGDAIDVAASRLSRHGLLLRPNQIALAVHHREKEASSALGGGVWVPHAVLPEVGPVAVLMTLEQPLMMDTPDRQPIRVVVLMISGDRGRQWLELLAQLARMANSDLAPALCASSTPDVALDVVKRWETTYV